MSIHIFPRLRSRICVLLLLAFAATLLPARHVAAEDQTVVLSEDQVRQSMWIESWSQATLNFKSLRAEYELRTYLLDNATFDGQRKPDVIDLQRRYLERLGPRSVDPDYRDNLPVDEVVRAMFDAASSLVDFNEAATKTWLQVNRFNAEEREWSCAGWDGVCDVIGMDGW